VIIIGLGWDSFVYAVDKRTSLAALTRPIIAAPVSRGHGDVLPADAQMPTAWALREPGAALGEILPV